MLPGDKGQINKNTNYIAFENNINLLASNFDRKKRYNIYQLYWFIRKVLLSVCVISFLFTDMAQFI